MEQYVLQKHSENVNSVEQISSKSEQVADNIHCM